MQLLQNKNDTIRFLTDSKYIRVRQIPPLFSHFIKLQTERLKLGEQFILIHDTRSRLAPIVPTTMVLVSNSL
ncbi:hypothetical protein DFQ01_12134 [Paenibacillus cellulosilyticus]|uniref:Uncharacterized protein n=1 Tax=Paenibacillus cellulosilyticus TaxID=375489 RepID=A0A2V2YS35_9BACL|nr:hypothetical protein DFQ01_12134 [Paenibacillus cellulosilyticus]